jgi:hypothetical protein
LAKDVETDAEPDDNHDSLGTIQATKRMHRIATQGPLMTTSAVTFSPLSTRTGPAQLPP